MGEFNNTTTDLGIDALSIGVSASGMEAYKERLKVELLDDAVKQIEQAYTDVMTEVNKGWQGVARDRFEQQFKTMCENISADLSAEYADLSARLEELQAFYFEQDLNLIEE